MLNYVETLFNKERQDASDPRDGRIIEYLINYLFVNIDDIVDDMNNE
jgi:hypothetical protein